MILRRVLYLALVITVWLFIGIYTVAKAAGPNNSHAEKGGGVMPQKATFAAGCFWGIEAAFSKVKGVVSTTVGYTGGHFEDPSYKDVCSNITGHAEAVELEYDASQVSFQELLEVFWDIHDPTTLDRQGPDVGSQYRSAIFFHTPEQEAAAKTSKEKLQSSGKYEGRVVTEITPASKFYIAEGYHQKYYEKRGIPGCKI